MKSFDEVSQKASTLPTIMWIVDEMSLIDDLMSLDIHEIVLNKERFLEILEELEESHTGGGYFELTPDNEVVFINFSRWLLMLKEEMGLPIHENTIAHFGITSAEIAETYRPKDQ
ncbi:MAG: hypothetical protein LBQ75_07460 [Zoogloeaceae bacterium]|nr:hypothetical protein [Zoogloeaceae bacterium]